MRHLGLTGSLALVLTACGGGTSGGDDSGESNIVRASLVGADQSQYGEVIVATGTDGLLVKISAENMKPGQYGVHIHGVGKCEGPDFKSAGDHWNPSGKQHGFDNPQGAHMGDFFNLDIGSDGTGSLETHIEGGTLQDGDNALLDDDGAAFVMHEGPDDLATEPSGNSGARFACGVFARQ